MAHDIRANGDDDISASYKWRSKAGSGEMYFQSQDAHAPLQDGSLEQFIAEHYWGYAAQRDGGCMGYEVAHPSWRVWQARQAGFSGKVKELCGQKFVAVLCGDPASAFLAEGSAVTGMRGRRL